MHSERAWPPTMFEELCKRIQHCCSTLRGSRNKRNVGSCWLKSLTGSNFAQQHATTSNNMQQGVQTDATCNIQQCWSCWPTMLRPFARGLIRTLNSLLLKAGAHLMGSCSRGLRPGLKVCSEHMNDWQYLSLGDLEQDEFFVWINKLAFQKEDKHT